MSQQVHFQPHEGARRAATAHAGDEHAVVEGSCPACGATPFKTAGVKGTLRHTHDEYIANAACTECHVVTGSLVVKVETLFGIEEDEAVLRGRPRVY